MRHQQDRRWAERLLQDRATGRIHAVYRYRDRVLLAEVDPLTGRVGQAFRLTHPWPERVQVHGGHVYYVYRPKGSLERRALYRERLPASTFGMPLGESRATRAFRYPVRPGPSCRRKVDARHARGGRVVGTTAREVVHEPVRPGFVRRASLGTVVRQGVHHAQERGHVGQVERLLLEEVSVGKVQCVGEQVCGGEARAPPDWSRSDRLHWPAHPGGEQLRHEGHIAFPPRAFRGGRSRFAADRPSCSCHAGPGTGCA